MARDFTDEQVGTALARLGHYRVSMAVAAADEGPVLAIDGCIALALGLRESVLQNVNNQADTDHGCFQISELYHAPFLEREPGCRVGTWKALDGERAIDRGMAPRYTPALLYALDMLRYNHRWAANHQVPVNKRLGFAIAAYNAGIGGAWAGWRESKDPDARTTGGDYSAWVLRAAEQVCRWLADHPNWRIP